MDETIEVVGNPREVPLYKALGLLKARGQSNRLRDVRDRVRCGSALLV